MKQLILIGDSIRMGYEPFVRESLAGGSRVWGPSENGGDSANVLAHLDEWVLSRECDVVHMNCGLHDIKKPFAGDPASQVAQVAQVAQVPIESYRANLKEIFEKVTGRAGVKLVWATTTPVNHAWHRARKGFDRYEEDVEAYNAASVELARRFGLVVNDLHSAVTKRGRDAILQPDGVHFSEEGCRFLAATVVDCLERS